MFDACPVHPKGTMVIPMLWRISGYVVCMLGVKNQKLHIPPYWRGRIARVPGAGERVAPARRKLQRRTCTSCKLERIRSAYTIGLKTIISGAHARPPAAPRRP
jgi:hypothetical protein